MTLPFIKHQTPRSALWGAALGLALSMSASAQSLTFLTLAGNAGRGSKDAVGTNAQFYHPQSVAVDANSNLFVADFGNNTIRKMTPDGTVTTFAGQAGNGRSGDGTGSGAYFNGPAGVAADLAGNVYVADSVNNTIRKITTNAVVTTLAGSSIASGSTDGTGTNAHFLQPLGVAVDASNNVYVADYGNHVIRKISSAGAVTTLAGTAGNYGSADGTGAAAQFYQPEGVAVDSSYNVYVADTGNGTIRKITSGGVVTTLAGSAGNYGSANGSGANAQFYQPRAVAVDAFGNVYVADFLNNAIRSVSSGGVVTTLAGTVGTAGYVDGVNSSAQFRGPQGLAVKANSSGVYVADFFNNAIRLVSTAGPSGATATVAGSASKGNGNGVNANARFSAPGGVAADANGNIYVADVENNQVRLINSYGLVSVVAGSGGNGNADGNGTNASFSTPHGVALDHNGNVFVTDTGNGTIRKITSAGTVTTFAGTAGYFSSLDGVGTNGLFNGPQGIAIDSANNIYVADTLNHTIRKITSGGIVTTLAGIAGNFGSTDGATTNARFYWPQGVAVDASGNIYVTERFNHTLRKITPAGVVTTIAGTAGLWGAVDNTNTVARFFQPNGIVVDGFGNIFVTDVGNNTVRELTLSGGIWTSSTVGGLAGITGANDGTGTSARFSSPTAIAVDGSGYLYVADSGNNTIRTTGAVVAYSPPSITSQPQPKATAAGNSAFFTVGATGGGPLVYSWQKNGSALADAGKFSGSATSSLTIANVQASEVASYSVVVTNLIGTASSASVTLLLAQAGSFGYTSLAADRSVLLQMNGTYGGSYDLQWSSNLTSWQSLGAYGGPTNFSYHDFSVTNGNYRFYRLKLNP